MGVLIDWYDDVVVAEDIDVASPLRDTFVIDPKSFRRLGKSCKEVRVEEVDPLCCFGAASLKMIF